MAEFAAVFLRSRDDPDIERLLVRIRKGSELERQQALAVLTARAQARGDPHDWNALGIGLHECGDHQRAADVFRMLVEHDPRADVFRLNLAMAFSQLEQIQLCRLELQHVAEHGSTEELRRVGRAQLEGYERFLGLTDEDRRLAELQLHALREVTEGSGASADDVAALARLLLRRERLEPTADGFAEAVEALEHGTERFPDHAPLLELLIACYLRSDPQKRLTAAIERLQRVDPHSEALRVMRNLGDESAREFSRALDAQASRLFSTALSPDADEPTRGAALDELERLVSFYPEAHHRRLQYAFALAASGQRAEALEQAAQLAATPDDSHEFHFNLGQIFWLCDDDASGRHHLNEAFRFAANDQEREDVEERIAYLEAGE